MTWLRARPQRCQYCCNTIGKWAAFVGVVNCGSCVGYMSTGRYPRCTVATCPGHDWPWTPGQPTDRPWS